MPAEPQILDKEDECERDSPVSEQRDEVRHNRGEMLLASNGEHGDDERDEERPDEARHGVEVVAQQLQTEAGAVVDADIVAQNGEDEEDEAELGEA